MNQERFPLRSILYGNAVFSGLSGLFLAFFSASAADFLGPERAAGFLLITGIGLVAFAAGILFFTSRSRLSPNFVLAVIIADVTWVIASLLLLIGGWIPFSMAGQWTVGLIALVVDVFATLQFLGWRRLS